MDNKKEYILCAAIQRKSPRDCIEILYNNDINNIEIGFRHCDILARFKDELSKSPYAQGFYTSKGRFVNRSEAMEIAFKCGQISKDKAISGYTYDSIPVYRDLFSEDLY